MFILHTSNRTENLLMHLAKVIEGQPLSSPFSTEVFLIQSQGMERWISQQLADHLGIWGNYQFYFPGNLFASMSERFMAREGIKTYQREQMVWIFERLLRDAGSSASGSFQVVNNYLNSGSGALKRFQLAQQLARIFDQYQMMRPDWLRAWSRGELKGLGNAEPWQAELWQQINKGHGHCHRGEFWGQTIAAIEQTAPALVQEHLPQRISIFGLNALPPLMLHLLKGLSRHTDIHLYLLAPTREYWGESGSRRQQILHPLVDDEGTLNSGHRLLQSLGEQARELQRLLLEGVEFSHEFSSYEEGVEDSILQRLQNDLLNNRSRREPFARDESIAIHSCHSPLREVEVIHDQLLALLDGDHTLELRDIVVMSPDIQDYSAHIKVVFGDIPHAIADRSLRDDSEILDNMVQFLKVARGRFGWQEVLELLEKPAIFPAFGLHEDELPQLRHWIAEVNIRWGHSAAHRQELGLPAFAEFSWQAGLERLMMGYAIGEHEGTVDGILPYAELEGNSAQPLGGLYRFMDLLAQAHQEFGQTATLRQWSERLTRYSSLLFGMDDPAANDEQGRGNLLQLLEQLSGELAAVHEGEVELAVIERWLQGTLSERKSSNGFLRGQLTFCSMLPMRAIPFKVIVLMGMNEGEYPRVIQPYTFDLMGDDHRPGDRSARNDDRAQFLEILLSARQRLLISYVGQSIQDNSEITPSAVVSELLDILELDYQQRGVVTRHPLQPFNPKYFETPSALFSYSQRSLKTALRLQPQGERAARRPWWQGTLQLALPAVVELSALFRFYKNPQRYFLESSLGIRLEQSEVEVDKRERFQVDGLENYLTNQYLVEQLLQRQRRPDPAELTGAGWWVGAAGELELERRLAAIEPFIEAIRALALGPPLEPLNIDLQLGAQRLVGQLGARHENGALIYRYTHMKGSDLLNGWLYHQLINQVTPTTTHLITQDRHLQFLPEGVNPVDLSRWLDTYNGGQQAPSYLLVEAALAYLQQLTVKSSKSPMDAARSCLHGQLDSGFNPEMALLYRGVEDIDGVIGEPFQLFCDELLQPMWRGLP